MARGKPVLTVETLCVQAGAFAAAQSKHDEPKLYGVTDGKAVGTYLKGKFIGLLTDKFDFSRGNSAKGIDLPELRVDIKTTSIRQPQSSSPFSSARQKVFGLGYSLLVFVYDKVDNRKRAISRLDIKHVIFVEANRTADHQTTRGLLEILDRDGNEEELAALMRDRMLPADDVEIQRIARDALKHRPNLGYLTISNALQWRLQYKRAINSAGSVDGVVRVH